MEEMKPTPIEDAETRRRMAELSRSQIDGSYEEIVQGIARRSISEERWKLIQAKMAHDRAMSASLVVLREQARAARTVGWVALVSLGTVAALAMLIFTLCSSPQPAHVLDDPEHYSRQP